MGREIRRVPVDWEHPHAWVEQWTDGKMRWRHVCRPLHGTSYSVQLAEWQREKEQWERGEHEHQRFLLAYHSVGPNIWTLEDGTTRTWEADETKPYQQFDQTGEVVVAEFWLESMEQLMGLERYESYAGDEPKPEDYFPDWSEDATLGYQLYETVSEGTPMGPAFATLQELEDWIVEALHYPRNEAHAFIGVGWGASALMIQDPGQPTVILDAIQAAAAYDTLH